MALLGGPAGGQDDTTWLLLTAFLIFTFQLGSVLITNAKNKNFGNYGVKVLINLSVSMICWYLTGYAFTYGVSEDKKLRNKFIGNYGFALHGSRDSQYAGPMFGLPFFFHTWTLCITANTIISNAIGGRGTILAHVLTTVYVSLFLYPVSAHWVMSTNGWLSAYQLVSGQPWETGVIDFGAAGPVHLFAGYVALACSIFTMKTSDMPRPEEPESNTLTLGTFISMFAHYGYISSASLAPSIAVGYSDAAGRAAINMTMAVASTLLLVLLAENHLTKSVNFLHASNAVTLGWVTVCSNCLTAEPWMCILAGLVAGAMYVGLRRKLHVLKDNDVFLIHGLGGIWSLVFTGVLAKPNLIRRVLGFTGSEVLGYDEKGIFFPSGDVNGKLLGLLILEMLTISGWALFMSLPLFAILHFSKKLVIAEAMAEPVQAEKEEAAPPAEVA